MSERAEDSESVFWGDADDAEALRRCRALVNAVDDGIYQLDPEGRFVAVNDVVVEATGYPREDLLGEHVSLLLGDKDVLAFEREIGRRLAESVETPTGGNRATERVEPVERTGAAENARTPDPTETFEFAIRTADGDRMSCELRFNLLIEDGAFQGTVGVVRNVTEQKRRKRELAEYNERERELRRYETIVEAVDDGVYVVDEDGRFTMVNEAYSELTGYAREDLLGEHVSLVVDEAVRRRAERAEATLRDGESDRAMVEAEVETASGERVPAEATFALFPGSDGEHRVGVVRDVSDRKERERALQERERQLSTLIDNVPGMVYRCRNNRSWRMEFVSDACRELTGYAPDAVERDEVSWGDDVIVDEDRAEVWETVQAAIEERETFSLTYRIETADGGCRWVRDYGRGVFDEDGSVVGVEGIVSDVTERKRLESEFDEMFGRVTDAFYALDDRWRFTHANERAEELVDYEGDGLVGRDFWEVFEWADGSTLGEEYRTAMETQEPTSFEFYYPEPVEAWYRVHAYPSETGLSVYFRDVTDRKGFEDALAALHDSSRELFRAESADTVARLVVEAGTEVLELSDVAIYLFDEERGDLYPAAKATDEGFMWDELPRIQPDDSTIAGHAFAASETVLWDDIRDSPNVITTETDMRSGVYVPVGDHGVVFAGSTTVGAFDERTRRLLELLAASAEVALDRVERERELEESERRYRTLVDHFPNGAVTLVDEELRYQTVGGDPLDATDATTDEIEGRPVRDVLPPEVADELAPRYEAALEGVPSAFESDSAGRDYRFHVVPVRDDDGDVFAALGMSQDVTERKESKRKLAESERRYRTLVENFPNGAVGLFDEDLRYTAAGGNVLDEVGVESDEIVGLTVWERYPEDVAATFEPNFRAALDGETNSFEIEYHGRRWLAHTLPVRDDEGTVFAGMVMIQDITERTEYERKLVESERRYRTLAEYFPNGIVTLFDHDLRYTLAAGQGFDDVPLEPADLEGNSFRDAWDEDTAEALEPAFQAALDGEERAVELTYAGREWMIYAVPITDERSDVFAGLSFAQDITEQVERERKLEETVEKLEESNERLESFASMLAHELRNPVTIGQIYSQQLPDEAAPDAVEYVTEAFGRIEDMIDVMLVLTRGREAVGERTPLSISDVTREAWEEVDAPDATLDVNVDAEMQADGTYVRHLFRNLLENAVEHGSTSRQPVADDAVEHGSASNRPEADDAVQHGDPNVTIRVEELPDGFYVADDGTGIPADERDAVFEAGFTTAGDHGGTGLGLAFVEKLADVYDWTCTVTESESGGARFEFRNVDLEPAE